MAIQFKDVNGDWKTVSAANPLPISLALSPTAVTSVIGTAGNVLVNGLSTPAQTGDVTLSLPTALTAINSVTASAATNLTFNAGSGNQNVGLVFSGTGFVYVGLNEQPSAMTDARLVVGTSGSGSAAGIFAYGGSPLIRFAGALGTQASPLHTLNGNTIGGFTAAGYTTDGAAHWSGSKASMLISATQDWTSSANGCKIVFGTTPNGSTTRADALTIDQDGTVTLASSIKTAAPAGGTAGAWKAGIRVAATVVLDTTQYIQLDVGGTLYKIAIAA